MNVDFVFSFQVVPLKTILDHCEGSAQAQSLKSMAFSVFTSCRWNMTHSIMGRSLTGFGPAAGADAFLKAKNVSLGVSVLCDTLRM